MGHINLLLTFLSSAYKHLEKGIHDNVNEHNLRHRTRMLGAAF